MNNPFNDRLVDLHHQVAELKVYDKETGCKLYQSSKIFGTLLDDLLAAYPEDFKQIAHDFENETENECKLACESGSEDERIDAFYNGVINLNDNINHSLDYFSNAG